MTATVTLAPWPAGTFVEWAERMWGAYRADLIRAGSSEAEAEANIARNRAALMPDGVLSPGQHLFEVRRDDVAVGELWLAERDGGDWFVYGIEIEEAHRGEGLGRATMVAAEEFVRSRGGVKLGLSVFGFNEVAQNLYRSLGFSVLAMNMVKSLA